MASTDVTYIESEADWLEFWANLGEDWNTIDLTPALRVGLETLEAAELGYFSGHHDPGGNPWAPLSQATIDRKGHDEILVDTDRLRGSLTEPNHPDAIRDVHAATGYFEFTFGTGVEYSMFHDAPSGRRPARMHVGWSEELFEQIADGVADAALEEWANAA